MVCAHERICQELAYQLTERRLLPHAWKWAISILEGLLVGWYPHKRHPTGSCSRRGCAVLMPRHRDPDPGAGSKRHEELTPKGLQINQSREKGGGTGMEQTALQTGQ